jgi:hypothetical protein
MEQSHAKHTLKPPLPQSFVRALSSTKAHSLSFPLLPSVRFGHRSSEFSTSKHAAALPCFSVWQRATTTLLSVFPPPHASPIAPPRCSRAHATELRAPRPPMSSSTTTSLLHRCSPKVGHHGKVSHPAAPQNGSPTSTASSPWPSLGASPQAWQEWLGHYRPQHLCRHVRVRAHARPLTFKAARLKLCEQLGHGRVWAQQASGHAPPSGQAMMQAKLGHAAENQPSIGILIFKSFSFPG